MERLSSEEMENEVADRRERLKRERDAGLSQGKRCVPQGFLFHGRQNVPFPPSLVTPQDPRSCRRGWGKKARSLQLFALKSLLVVGMRIRVRVSNPTPRGTSGALVFAGVSNISLPPPPGFSAPASRVRYESS